jgi:hypothetical protein
MFIVATATFRILYTLIVLDHGPEKNHAFRVTEKFDRKQALVLLLHLDCLADSLPVALHL